MEIRRKDALDYHSQGRKGKIEVTPTKPCRTQWDLSLAYTPGVAEPCKEIQKNQDFPLNTRRGATWWRWFRTAPRCWDSATSARYAGKPVMEGKGVLFKRFADIDVFDLEVGSENPDDVIKFCQLLEPTCGGINLEDIKAPECFYIEETSAQDHVHPGVSRRPARHRHHLRGGAAERRWSWLARKLTRCAWSSTARARRAWPPPCTMCVWACARKTSPCATSTG
jgi:hypothetical protein